MELNELKSKVYLRGLSMKEIPNKLGISKQHFYKLLKKKDEKMILKLKEILK